MLILEKKQETQIIKKYLLDKKKSYKCRCGSKLQIKFLDVHYRTKKHIQYIRDLEHFNKFGYYK